MNQNHALSQYNQVSLHTSVTDASPHKLIDLLLLGFLERVAQARVAILNNKIEMKGNRISKAIDILAGLRAALDFEKGGKVATNLDDLYEYMTHLLISANLNNDLKKCDEATDLMRVIRDGWNGLDLNAIEEHK